MIPRPGGVRLLLPGYHPIADSGKFSAEWGAVPQTAGLTLPEMVESGRAGKLKAFYVVGANPVGRFQIDPFVFSQSFVVVQDMFLTETAALADVVLPAANAYEKTGTFTNTCGYRTKPSTASDSFRSFAINASSRDSVVSIPSPTRLS